MSNSTTNLDLVAQAQALKEITANALFDAGSPATLFGRRASLCSGLNWFYYGGMILVDGVLTAIANNAAAITLAANTTNYIQTTRAGVVTSNTTGFTVGQIPLYVAVTGPSTVVSWTDNRTWVKLPFVAGLKARVMASDANITLTQAEAACDILSITSSVSLTALRNVVVPLFPQEWTVFNGTTGAQSLQFIGATGTGITVANGKRARIYSDGTNIQRSSADI